MAEGKGLLSATPSYFSECRCRRDLPFEEPCDVPPTPKSLFTKLIQLPIVDG
jgi:hypothetical protein